MIEIKNNTERCTCLAFCSGSDSCPQLRFQIRVLAWTKRAGFTRLMEVSSTRRKGFAIFIGEFKFSFQIVMTTNNRMLPAVYFFPYPSCGCCQNNKHHGPAITAEIKSLWEDKADDLYRDRRNWYQNFFLHFSG